MNSTVEFFRETERGSPVLLREFKLRILVELVMQSSIFFPGLLCDDKKELDFSKRSLLKIVFVSLISFQLILCVLRFYIFFQLGALVLTFTPSPNVDYSKFYVLQRNGKLLYC